MAWFTSWHWAWDDLGTSLSLVQDGRLELTWLQLDWKPTTLLGQKPPFLNWVCQLTQVSCTVAIDGISNISSLGMGKLRTIDELINLWKWSEKIVLNLINVNRSECFLIFLSDLNVESLQSHLRFFYLPCILLALYVSVHRYGYGCQPGERL